MKYKHLEYHDHYRDFISNFASLTIMIKTNRITSNIGPGSPFCSWVNQDPPDIDGTQSTKAAAGIVPNVSQKTNAGERGAATKVVGNLKQTTIQSTLNSGSSST